MSQYSKSMGPIDMVKYVASLPFRAAWATTKFAVKKVNEGFYDPIIKPHIENTRRKVEETMTLHGNRVDEMALRNIVTPYYRIRESIYSTLQSLTGTFFTDFEKLKRTNREQLERATKVYDRRRLDIAKPIRDEREDYNAKNQLMEKVNNKELQPMPESDDDLIYSLTRLINNYRNSPAVRRERKKSLRPLKLHPVRGKFSETVRKRAAITRDSKPDKLTLPLANEQIMPYINPSIEHKTIIDAHPYNELRRVRSNIANEQINLSFDLTDRNNKFLLNGDPDAIFQRIINNIQLMEKILHPKVTNISIGIDRKGSQIGVSIILSDFEEERGPGETTEEFDAKKPENIANDWRYENVGQERYWMEKIPARHRVRNSEIWNLYKGVKTHDAAPGNPRRFKNWYSLYRYYLFREKAKALGVEMQINIEIKATMPSAISSAQYADKTPLGISIKSSSKTETLELFPGTDIVSFSKEIDQTGPKRKKDKNRPLSYSQQATLVEYLEILREKLSQMPEGSIRSDDRQRSGQQQNQGESGSRPSGTDAENRDGADAGDEEEEVDVDADVDEEEDEQEEAEALERIGA